MTVNSGGTLEGNGGIITGNVQVQDGGSIIPGNSIGNIPVDGDVSFECGSSLTIEVDNSANSTMTITGALLIAEGCVDIEFDVHSGFTGARREFEVISAGSISGTFHRASTNNPLLTVLSIDYSGGSVSVNIDIDLSDFTDILADSNARRVGIALTTLIQGGNETFGEIVASLLDLPNLVEVVEALDQMQPAMFKGLAITQENNAVKIQDSLGYRFEQVLNQVHCYKSRSQDDSEYSNNPRSSRNQIVDECERDEKMINVWASGFGDLLYQGSNRYADSPQVGYQSNTSGVTLGLDGHFAEYYYAGALGAYTNSDIDWHNGRGSGGVETGYAGIYFSAIGDLFYGNFSVIGGWSHYHAKRNIEYTGINLTAKNSHGGAQLLSHVDTGFNLGRGGFTVRPFDSFDYISQKENKFTETGAGVLDLDVRKSNAIMMRNELGLQFSGCLCFNSSKWTIAPKASWVREIRVKGENFTSSFVNTTGVTFSSTGYFSNRNLFSPGVLITGLMWDERLALELYYNGEFRHDYSDNNYGGQIRFGF